MAAKANRAKSKSRGKPAPAKKAVVRRKKLKVAIAGFGTVGRSVAKLLCQEASDTFELTHIFNRDVARKKVDWVPASVRWTESINEVLSSDIDIFVELAGGVKPAGDWIRKALRAGKSVVTANKQLIAESGPELIEVAREAGRRLEFGASVAGGIPAIMGIQEGLAGDRLFKIAGVLNGTCNFILTKMEATGASFEAALKEAQELGYAEADPTNDVEGYDARAKLVILAQAGLRVRLQKRTDSVLADFFRRGRGFCLRARIELHDPADFAGQKRNGRWVERACICAARAGSGFLARGARRGQQESGDGHWAVRGANGVFGFRSGRRSHRRGRGFRFVFDRAQRRGAIRQPA